MSSRFAGGSVLPGGGLRVGRGSKGGSSVLPPAPPVLMLEKLPSQNLELSQIIHRDAAVVEQGYTKVMLRGVPRFLIDAFGRILEEGKSMEGLFRKEGNAARMKNSQDVYYCRESVRDPPWTIHDVCSLVKRFLRDLKTPLITAEIKARLLDYARVCKDGVIEPHKLTILFEPTFSDRGMVHPMPAEHIGTLGFIMRQLYELSKDHAVTQMTVANLATVFAPTIFRDAGGTGSGAGMEPPKTPKNGGKSSLTLQKSMEENHVMIDAMVLLIRNSQWIGVPSNFYLTSRQDSSSSSTASGYASSTTTAATAAAAPTTFAVPLQLPAAAAGGGWSRSNSLRPAHSLYGAAALAALPAVNFSKAEKGGSVSGRKIEKRHSVKMVIANRGRQEEKEGKDRRRSNSTVRDLFKSFGDRVRRKSTERKSPSRQSSPARYQTAASSDGGNTTGGSSRGRSPTKKIVLEIDDEPMLSSSALAAPLDHYGRAGGGGEMRSAVATSRPSLKSSSFLQALPSKSPKLAARKQQAAAVAAEAVLAQLQPQRPARPVPPAPGASTATVTRVASKEKKKCAEGREQQQQLQHSRRRVSGGGGGGGTGPAAATSLSAPVVMAAAAAATATTQQQQALPRRASAVRDEPNSILGEEFFSPPGGAGGGGGGHKFPVNRVRRHTAPIKTGLALRRNQPNTVHSYTKGPAMQRRATMAAADDKENSRLIRVVARRRDNEMDEEEWCDEEDDTLTDTNQTMTAAGGGGGGGGAGIAVVYAAAADAILEMTHLESRARRANWKRRRSGGAGGGERGGEREKGEEKASPGRKESAGAALSTTRKSPAPPPLPLCSPPGAAAATASGSSRSKERVSSGHRSRSRRDGVSGEEEEMMEGVEMRQPPLSAPPIPNARTSLSGGGLKPASSPHFAIPALPPLAGLGGAAARSASSSSSSSSASFATTPYTSRRPIAATPLAARAPVPAAAAAHSPLGRRGSSASALDSPQFKAPSSLATRRQLSMGEKEFAASDRNRAAILDAYNETELQLHAKVGTRPSVALLRNNNRGMVQQRVNLFAAIQSTSDAENASMRSSLGSSRQSLSGLDETLLLGTSTSTCTVRAGGGGPPVGHSITSSGGSSSSSGRSSKRSSIASASHR